VKPYKWLIAAAAVIVLALGLMYFHALPQTHSAEGTQSDPRIGSSKYPAPKNVNNTPPADALASITDPNGIPPLADVNAKCDSAPPHATNRPSLQDDGKGAQQYADMPDNPSTATYKCAIARAKVAGYKVIGNSVKCDEAVVKLLDKSGNTLKSFRPFCMNVGTTGDATCSVQLIPTDNQGNFIWADEPDLLHQNKSEEYVSMQSAFTGC
jgi:hypothetical protein